MLYPPTGWLDRFSSPQSRSDMRYNDLATNCFQVDGRNAFTRFSSAIYNVDSRYDLG